MNHANDLDCTWVLAVDSDLSSDGYIVKVTFSVLELECDDSLKFYDGNNNTMSRLLGSYCDVHPEVIYSTGQYMYVKFHTDYVLTYKGFSFSFSAVKEGTVMVYPLQLLHFIITQISKNLLVY